MKPLFAGTPDDALLGYGVPAEWRNDVKQATGDTLLALADHLPAEWICAPRVSRTVALRFLERTKFAGNPPQQTKWAVAAALSALSPSAYISGTTSSATMLMILMSGLIAGPAVSL